MKTTDMSDYGDQSCSCTSCVYRSESDRPSLRRIISQGSRIDRLYYGKYIPLRERKLLEKLVRTRGVYDNIKAQLLSSSTISLDTNSVLKPHRKLSAKKLNSPQYSETILELVNLVDKGEKLESKELSGCCSCCSCSSKLNLHYKSTDKQRPKRAYPGAYRHIHTREKIGDNRKRGVRFKAKHIKSDPCTCTFKFSGMLKNLSKAKSKKIPAFHPVTLVDLKPATDEEITRKPKKNSYLVHSSVENLQQSKTRLKNMMMEGIRNIGESKTKMQEKIDLYTKKSLEKLSKMQNNTKSKINVQKKPREVTKNNNIATCDCPEKKLISLIKKNSIVKFKDDLRRKRILKDWQCDFDCVEDICIPEECYYKLKQIGSRHLKPRYDKVDKVSAMQDQIIGVPLINPSIKIESKQLRTFEPIVVGKQKPLLRAQQARQITRPSLSLTTDKEQKMSKKVQKDIKKVNKKKLQILCKCKKNSKYKDQNVKLGAISPATAVTNKSRARNLIINPPRKKGLHIYPKSKVENISPESRQQVVRIGSSFNFNIEFYRNKAEPSENISRINLQRLPNYMTRSLIKNNNEGFVKKNEMKTVNRRHRGSQIILEHPKKNTKTGEDNLKRCLCLPKLKSKRNKINTDIKKDIDATEKLFSAPCTPADCPISNKCNLKECKRKNLKLNNVETNTYYTYPNIIKITKRGQNKLKEKQLLLPYECEPGVCIPSICDPYQCIKLITTRKVKSKQRSAQCDCSAKTSYSGRNKSTSSLISIKTKSLSLKPKFVKSMISHKSTKLRNKFNKVQNISSNNINNVNTNRSCRQVVRIGSTFSFNLEFYKNKSPYSSNPVKLKRLPNETHPASYKKIENQKFLVATPSNKYLRKKSGIVTTLKRCFCTLKLQEKKNIKTKRKKILTTGANFINNVHPNVAVTSDKSTKTKNNTFLQAIECEPFVCIPGACDPYDCLERINKRYKHLKEIASITEPLERKSVSSTTYSKKSLKTISIQSKPYSKDRKSFAKPKKITNKFENHTSARKINQTVKIGSSFSFDIKFIKTITPIKEVKSKLQVEQKNQQHFIKEKIKRKNKMNKLNVANVTTQIKEERQPKASMAGHLVKRCFCTLNLLKYRKHQTEKNDFLTPSRHPSIFPREYTINRAVTALNPFLPCKKNCNGWSCSYNSSRIDKWKSSSSFTVDSLMYLKKMEITNLNQYVRQCFCTMNLQLLNKNISNKKPKSAIPFSIGKSPEIALRNDMELSKCDKSSVRVGSSFSYNIEFCKNISSISKSKKYVNNLFVSKYSSDAEFTKPNKNISKKLKNVGTERNNIYFNQQSQSAINELTHKALTIAPTPRKCFCTLKLQKRGRKYVKNDKKLLTKMPNIINPSLGTVMTVNKEQNTVFKPLNIAHSLKPYECEPNICNPGYCDPYQCLEIMKRKKVYKHTKESGVDTIQSKKSTSSLTVGNISKGTQKTYLTKMKPKQNEVKVSRKTFESDISKPSKQIVRVGSNFSFNIEFFKDQISPTVAQNITNDLKERKQVKHTKNVPKIRARKKDQITSQNSRFVQDKETENKKSPRIASTVMTSFTRLKNKNNYIKLKDDPTFLKKCLCLLKSIKLFTAKNEGINKVAHFDKKTNTRNIIILDEQQRHPYECEPGICIPGECDAYDCYKILKNSKNKKISKGLITAETKNSRSISSNSAILTKNAKTQLRNRKNVRDIEKTNFLELSVKDSDRQAVKIGSNFSFNIEFYKDRLPKRYVNQPPQQLHKSKENKFKEINRKNIKKETISTRSQRSQIDPIRNRDNYTKDNYFLKRCFCTLQLHNQYSDTSKVQIKEKKKDQGVKLSTKSVMTKNEKHPLSIPKIFECEPNICIPYECDPYECEKIMKIRRKQHGYREVGSLTKSPKKFVVSSATNSFKKSKHTTQTTVANNYRRNVHYKNKYKESRPSQKVKIGSSFEFNIEFCKDKNDPSLKINKQPNSTHIKSKHPTHEKVNKSTAQNWKHKQVKFEKTGTKAIKSQSTMINTSPLLKRCFCTLFLKKPNKVKHITLKKITSNVGTETEKAFAQTTLLPYECEPQVCIPGECNPVECLERIMKRRCKNFGGTTNFLQTKNSASTMTMGKVKSKVKKNQCRALNEGDFQSKEKMLTNFKKQSIRIGSNFNFNIEFCKDNIVSNNISKKLDNKEKLHRREKKSELKVNHPVKPILKTKSQLSSSDKSFLKRCFCTLKLKKQACDVSNCPEFKRNSTQIKEQIKTINKNCKKTRKPNFLKKCLCVFKIRKIDRQKHTAPLNSEIIKKQPSPRRLNQNISKQEKMSPFECEPYVCLPGKCDPYECEKRIRKRILCREIENGSYISKITATDKVTSKSIKVQAPKMKSDDHTKTLYLKKKRNQRLSNVSNRDDNRNSATIMKRSLLGNRIVDIPKFGTNLNKKAVKIGSNMSFNIELYKETTPKIKSIIKQKISKSKNISTKSAFIRNRGSQAKVIKTEDKTLEVQNALNRCFCTLKLQKNMRSRYHDKNLNPLGESPQYPQTFEIRRVAVQKKPKISPEKACSTVRSVATRINKKYIKENDDSLRNFCPCKYGTLNFTEMETILPYAPTKYNKNSSKTLLPVQNKFLSKDKIKGKNKIIHGKKLHKKKSKRNINYINKNLFNENELNEKSVSLKRFLCRCAALFISKQKNNTANAINYEKNSYNNNHKVCDKKSKRIYNMYFGHIKSSKSDRRPVRQIKKQDINVKKSKSVKLDDKCVNKCILYSSNIIGHNEKYPTVTFRVGQKRNHGDDTIKENNKQSLKSAQLMPDAEIAGTTKPHLTKLKERNDEIMCIHCQNKIQEKSKKDKGSTAPLKVHFVDVTSNANFLGKTSRFRKRFKSAGKRLKYDEDKKEWYKYCNSCGKIFNKVEFLKAAGDRSLDENKRNLKYPNNRIKDVFKPNKNTDNVCSGQNRERPLFKMQLNYDDYNIINKDEVIGNVTKFGKKNINNDNKLTKSHEKSCRCCFCLFKENKTGAHIHVAAKGSKIGRTLGKLLGNSKAKTPTFEKPCTCGSFICSKNNKKIKESRKMINNKKYWKPCFCGSPICDRESATMRAISVSPDKIKCICIQENEKIKRKIRAIKEAEDAKHRAIFLKKHSKEDRIRSKKRQKEDKEMEKRINKKASDLVLVAESAIDIGKLGITACTNVLRSVARSASDPKQAYYTLKAMKKDPKLIALYLKSAFNDSGVSATARRVRLRCLAMRGVKKVKSTLEKYAVTNFLLHIADKDPKSRLPKSTKPKRVRERLDYGCSLYMASLRKRPYLSIYDRCPWFYPHFLSLVNVWKQFTDIMLFLLAVVVWSPCILCMEVCRAMMCCFFCTG